MEIKHENLIGTFEQKREQVKQFNLILHWSRLRTKQTIGGRYGYLAL